MNNATNIHPTYTTDLKILTYGPCLHSGVACAENNGLCSLLRYDRSAAALGGGHWLRTDPFPFAPFAVGALAVGEAVCKRRQKSQLTIARQLARGHCDESEGDCCVKMHVNF